MTTLHTLALAAMLVITPVIVCGQNGAANALATSTGKTYSASSLSPEGQKLYADRQKFISEGRSALFSRMLSDILLELEAKARNTTTEKLLAEVRSRVPEPTASQIQAVYDANRQALAGRTVAEVRPQIVEFIKGEAEGKAIEAHIETLRAKYKPVLGKGVNAFGGVPTDVIVTIGERKITLGDFEYENRVPLNDIEMGIYEQLLSDLETSIFSVLVSEEAAARNADASSIIASEITDKLKEFTDDERAILESELMARLFAKYKVKILLPEPVRLIQNISVDDDPSIGNAAAPVTVVMFTDFQCPVCARSHPVLKVALAGYGDRVRLVVRDYPLEQMHKNSFEAALAANAAAKQGKFVEFTELLYRRQDALDKASLLKYAGELGLNVKQFELDFSDPRTAAEVRKDQADGLSYGVSGTPTIYVNGIKVHRLSLLGFRAAIDRALKK